MTNTFNDFVNAIKKDNSDSFNRLPYNHQLKIGYDSLIQNAIFKELINIMGATITDLDMELKMKISRIDYLESKTNSQVFKEYGSQLYSDSCAGFS